MVSNLWAHDFGRKLARLAASAERHGGVCFDVLVHGGDQEIRINDDQRACRMWGQW